MRCRNHALVKVLPFIFAPLTLTLSSGESVSTASPQKHTRVADVIGGHVHPSICVTHSGMIIVIYNKEGGGGKRLLLCHSQDQGESWSVPRPINTIRNCSIYPGSLTTLSDGSLLLNWSCYHVENGRRWREPQFSLSEDEGVSWSTVQSVPLDNLSNYSCLRHPIVELSKNSWVLPFYDRTVVYDYSANAIHTFGDGRNHGMVPMGAHSQGNANQRCPARQCSCPRWQTWKPRPRNEIDRQWKDVEATSCVSTLWGCRLRSYRSPEWLDRTYCHYLWIWPRRRVGL